MSSDHGILSGRMVRLRPVAEDDLDLLAGWFGDPGFIDHWGDTPLTREQVAAKYIGRRRPEVESFIVLTGDAPIGYAQYWHAGEFEGGIDLILEPHGRGRGYGPDAADTLARHLLQHLHWTRVTADPVATNARAIRAWEKAGFRRVGQHGEALIMERQRQWTSTDHFGM
ncbi:GNAT family N-acetyltransferase [Dactylosporangium maewongense]